MKFEEKLILIGGNPISYIDEGQASGMPIIFIHGFPFNKWTWQNQLEVLKDKYRVVAYDVQGHGKSGMGSGPFTITQFADDLFLFMDAIKIEAAIVCGLSMGGYIALNAIRRQPTRIEALILCDTQCAADTEEGKKKRMDTIASVREKGLTQYAHDSVQKLFSKHSLSDKADAVLSIKKTILQTPVESIVNTLKALADREETCSSLQQINIPVLILVGESDTITPPEAAKKMNALITGSTFKEIELAGHVSNLENPESFNSHIKNFLSAIGPASKRKF